MDKNTREQMTEEMADVQLIIGKILRLGVMISATVMIIGLVLLIVKGNGGYPHNAFPTDFTQIWAGIAELKPYAIMMLGIFLLILTPVLRVVVSIYSFYREGDSLYVWITTIVLVILGISFVFGILR
ncbi:DUF1634 domain-containing protein [Lentilactobacillus buchneri]|uniref:DUF1634 domain-containing protein n=1 Tax=Lentilactobacillus buchneri DSM 20057 TaxID=1423728 RepID=A0A4R5NJJ4_LENBU|nr:DUF1634 domain-containing protein [Lentilactobacillus buchneri]WCJ52268.1 DUF1634 domain-containing protein [Lentilactobacillus sp. Egmn17]AEB73993.1 protein of unknown function DUF1634 [Lentilactobacillus buchneri NRRL B-30929]KRK68902.1 hypothetical protein FC79_GL002341 [Lentilactobacillus buchneri DSM 20057]MCT2882755.1 DUF1634 domain-containing protein [Lentilactobacillus buchneri]MCT2898990.1 DUF1634 domain-containing protein [Lentilactobacillus buchneri]